jgi:predicted O-methyltransferase YrrM
MPSLNRKLRQFRKGFAHWLFRNGQRFKVDILPRHFYSSVPDLRELRRYPSWRGPRTMVGVKGVGIEEQLAAARQFCPAEARERLRTFEVHQHAIAENEENGYGPIEADFLYCFIAAQKPRRVVQVGAGVSTAVILRSAADAGYSVDVTCVDPYPSNYLRRAAAAGKIKLLAERAQEVDLAVLTDVGQVGMLFVDSTHTVKAGSEVNRIIFEVLPRLPKGAMVHFHDIFFPYDYQPSIFEEPFFSQESALLHAYLANNERYRVRVSMSMLHYAKPRELQELLPRYKPRPHDQGVQVPGSEGHFPSATYLELIA